MSQIPMSQSMSKSTSQSMSEPRRYFPDWTRCAFASGREVEADHNSYLAGGYAEEFGYMATSEWSRGVPVLDEPPDRYRKRRGQAQMTHAGYPLRAHPLIGGIHGMSVEKMRMRGRASRTKLKSAAGPDLADHGNYFTVHLRLVDGKRGDTLERAKRAAVRVTSSIVSWPWAQRHRAIFPTRR